jgi:hypothetical protein
VATVRGELGELHDVADERGLVHLPVEEERQPDPGATSSTYSIASVSAADAGSYSAVVTGTCGTIQTNPATLTREQHGGPRERASSISLISYDGCCE